MMLGAGISIDYFEQPGARRGTGPQIVRITQGQPCCRATNSVCDDPRPYVGPTGCVDCGHSGGCHT